MMCGANRLLSMLAQLQTICITSFCIMFTPPQTICTTSFCIRCSHHLNRFSPHHFVSDVHTTLIDFHHIILYDMFAPPRTVSTTSFCIMLKQLQTICTTSFYIICLHHFKYFIICLLIFYFSYFNCFNFFNCFFIFCYFSVIFYTLV